MHVVDPCEPARLLARRVNHHVAVTDCVTGRLRERLDLDPPLHRQTRLDGLTGPLGVADAVQVRALLGDDAPLLGERLADLHAGFEPVHAVETRSAVGDLAGLVHDGGHRQVVPQAHLEVVRVVRRGGDFHCAGAEGRVDVIVCDDRDLPFGDRMVDRGADEVLVALVLGGAPRRRCRRASSRRGWSRRSRAVRRRSGSRSAGRRVHPRPPRT